MVYRSAYRAVMYVRMSTDSQDYSTDHQRAKILEYAASRELSIVREYVDDGKSGLDIKRRAGLRALMNDVQSPGSDFSYIIVYDVSRWGRFQDIDEAAYYEHTCRRAGVKVLYCGERFPDDTGPYASLLKSMKRVMAAEYSRDLSEKVFIAQVRFIEMGFKQGGSAGYGLRRLAIKACGTPRAVLEFGESKISATDRVVLIWGPDHEVATVRRVYALYLEGASEMGLARLLNTENILTEFGRPWTHAMVNSLLTNVKYCGSLAYNRRSGKLSMPRVRTNPNEWIVNRTALDAIIPTSFFEQVQAERARRRRRYTSSELIILLQACHQKYGKVTAPIIAADPEMPDPQLFVRTFGSLVRAYDAAKLPRALTYVFVDTKRKLSGWRKQLLSQVEACIRTAGGTAETTRTPLRLLVNGNLTVRVDVAVARSPKRGYRNWRIAGMAGVDFTICGRADPNGCGIRDYFLISAADLCSGPIYLKESNLIRYSKLRYASIQDMFGIAGAQQIADASERRDEC